MEMKLERVQLDPDVTIGYLTIDGDSGCWILEDAVREVPGQSVYQWKVKGKTAIPYGKYDVIVNQSMRFKRELPLLLNVPGFDGIRIHPGNTAEDTEGCLLPGDVRLGKSLGKSRAAFDALFTKIKEARGKGERVTIEITA